MTKMKCVEESSPGYFTFVQHPINQTTEGQSARMTGIAQNATSPYVVGSIYDLAPLTASPTKS